VRLLAVWILNAIALLAVAYLLPSIQVTGFVAALIAAAVIGLVNVLIKPVLILLTLPVTILTLGLFIFVINGLLFYLVGEVLEGFQVESLLSGILGAILYSVISWLLTSLIKDK